MKWWVLSGLIAFCGSAGASAREGFLENPGLLADYNAELRGGDGRLDVARHDRAPDATPCGYLFLSHMAPGDGLGRSQAVSAGGAGGGH